VTNRDVKLPFISIKLMRLRSCLVQLSFWFSLELIEH
jgi:hypothetical protein